MLLHFLKILPVSYTYFTLAAQASRRNDKLLSEKRKIHERFIRMEMIYQGARFMALNEMRVTKIRLYEKI